MQALFKSGFFKKVTSSMVANRAKAFNMLKFTGFVMGMGFSVSAAHRFLTANSPKDRIQHVSEKMSDYLSNDDAWFYPCLKMSRFGYVAPGTFQRLCEHVAQLLYIRWRVIVGEIQLNYTTLFNVTHNVGVVIECIRVLRLHVHAKFGALNDVVTDFDAVASQLNQQCMDMQHNMTLTHGLKE